MLCPLASLPVCDPVVPDCEPYAPLCDPVVPLWAPLVPVCDPVVDCEPVLSVWAALPLGEPVLPGCVFPDCEPTPPPCWLEVPADVPELLCVLLPDVSCATTHAAHRNSTANNAILIFVMSDLRVGLL